ncbi:MAG: hypothetical protein WCF12_15580 [Propionicimonas sp.]
MRAAPTATPSLFDVALDALVGDAKTGLAERYLIAFDGAAILFEPPGRP